MSEGKKPGSGTAQTRQEIEFHQIKSEHFRVIHVDGASGGVTPKGYIQMALYNERIAIPRKMVHNLSEDGSLGTELTDKREGRKGFVREIEINALLDIEAARALASWLLDKVKAAEETLKRIAEKEG